MTRYLVLFAALCLSVSVSGQGTQPRLELATRLLGDGTRSLLVHVRQPAGQTADEIRVELPRGVAELAVPLSLPVGWKSTRDGSALRVAGAETPLPFRMRIALLDARDPGRLRVRLRLKGRDVWEETVLPAPLPVMTTAARPKGLLQVPGVVSPGSSVDFLVLDPKRTPSDGQWIIAGAPGTPAGTDRVRAELPADLQPGSPLRVSYFDVWGERILDALTSPDVVVTAPEAAPATPRISGCARYGFVGEGLCVCGDFPETARAGLTIDGQPATVLSASRYVIHVRLADALAPGPHTIAGDVAAGFAADNRVDMRALSLRASIDANALLRGESTTMRVALDGAVEPFTLAVTNRTPGVISIPGGNYQEIELSPDVNRPVERRVNARLPGAFLIDTDVPLPQCPCMDRPEQPSAASRPVPLFVPRRVLATIAVAAPAAMLTTAQTVAAANGMSVVEVIPLPLAGAAMAVFEIVDGIAVPAKVAAVAADPNVILAQPDFVYDTSQAGRPAGGPVYGPGMIGADVARQVATGSGVRVAVIDAGIDSDHPSLAKKVVDYSDVTGTGWTPDVHGTLVAGVIASEPGDTGGAPGVAPGAAIVAVKACVAQSITQAAARCWSSTLARGIDAASRKDVRVMNLSVGGPEDKLLARMVEAAAGKGIAVVSAAGNDGPSGKPSFPAAIDNVIAVTAVDAEGKLYGRATHGAFIDLAAPGVDILSSGPGGRTQLFSGTSAAAASASGAVALLLERSKLSPAEISALLRTTAKDLGAPGKDAEFGDGLLDVCRAISRAAGRQVPCR